jgi:hypothetical protein
MTTIYEAIFAKFAADFPEIRWVDLDKGQMNFERPTIVFPAALISIKIPQAENINRTLQRAYAIVTIRLCYDFTGNTSLSTPEAERLKSFAYLGSTDKIYSKFQGWGTAEINPLERTNSFDEQRPDAYKVNSTSFKTDYLEATAA